MDNILENISNITSNLNSSKTLSSTVNAEQNITSKLGDSNVVVTNTNYKGQETDTAKVIIDNNNYTISVNVKEDGLINKQDTLTAGTNISIENNIISNTLVNNSQLQNDSNYITNETNDLQNYYDKNNTYNKDEINNTINEKVKTSVLRMSGVEMRNHVNEDDILEGTVVVCSDTLIGEVTYLKGHIYKYSNQSWVDILPEIPDNVKTIMIDDTIEDFGFELSYNNDKLYVLENGMVVNDETENAKYHTLRFIIPIKNGDDGLVLGIDNNTLTIYSNIKLNLLKDVNIQDLKNNQILAYNQESDKWVNVDNLGNYDENGNFNISSKNNGLKVNTIIDNNEFTNVITLGDNNSYINLTQNNGANIIGITSGSNSIIMQSVQDNDNDVSLVGVQATDKYIALNVDANGATIETNDGQLKVNQQQVAFQSSLDETNANVQSAISNSSQALEQSTLGLSQISAMQNNTTKIANTNGGASVGSGSSATVGFSGGNGAVGEVDCIQLGTGTNNQSKTLQVYDDNIYNATTHNLSVNNIQTNNLVYQDKPITFNYVDYSQSQSLTPEQQAQARSNIGAGSSGFSGDFNDLANVPQANTAQAGIIQIATDSEASDGTSESLAITPKQLKTAIDGIGTVFDLKGSVATVDDLPTTGNTIGDVYYVQSESVGYIWLNDGITDRWEQLGASIDLSNYVQVSDVVNNLTSTDVDKPLSAYQGNVLNQDLNSLETNATIIANSNSGFIGGTGTHATSGGAIGKNATTYAGGAIGDSSSSAQGGAVGAQAQTGYGGAVGSQAQSTTGGAIGNLAVTTGGGAIGQEASSIDGFAGGYQAIATVTNAIQLGTGTNNTDNSLQVLGDNIYNASTHTLTVQNATVNGSSVATQSDVTTLQGQITTNTGNITTNTSDITEIKNNTTNIADSLGGFSGGNGANASTSGGAVGSNAKATMGGAVGANAIETQGGGAVGANAKATQGGGAVGISSGTTTGGSVGMGAQSTRGGAVGASTKATNGFSGGHYAQSSVDCIQLGSGTNSTAKSLQIYNDNIYNSTTHTLTVQNASIKAWTMTQASDGSLTFTYRG